VIETLPLDGKRRVILLKCDDREHLVLLGQNQDLVLGGPEPALASAASAASEPQRQGSEPSPPPPLQPSDGVSR